MLEARTQEFFTQLANGYCAVRAKQFLPYPRLIAKICNNAGATHANEQQTKQAIKQTTNK
jgi:hypothetical protein